MTPAQLTTLGAYIAAQPDLNSKPSGSDGAYAVAQLLNLPDASNTQLYAPNIPSTVLINAIVETDMAGLTVQQCLYLDMLLRQPTIDGTNAVIGAAIGSLFAGKQTLTNFQALTRAATRFELLFTTNHVVSPANLYGYQVQTQDVQQARGN